MNRAKWNFPVTPNNIELFTTLLRDIHMYSPFWEGHPAHHANAHLQFPTIWQPHGSALTMGIVAVGEEEEDDEGLEEVTVGDEEGDKRGYREDIRGGKQAGNGGDGQLLDTAKIERENDESSVAADADFLFNCQSYMPDHLQVGFNEAILRLQQAAMRCLHHVFPLLVFALASSSLLFSKKPFAPVLVTLRLL
ncbi:hypothetical protein G6011_05323 [Alternaria panax]|uniref:Uncharacterized protein n=1 Tax=Alternaria panax TaxID=48097 RepID=A0AAD4I6N3_9PLEO|nr:hypothetical protein G6011_05323 [Alternaria panax]